MQVWEQILLGMAALILVFLFWPGVKIAMQKSSQSTTRDWPAVLIPVGVVILFVALLIIFARS